MPWLSPLLSSVIKQLTNSINKRLCENSANEQLFNTIKPVYENALRKSGYKSSLKYSEDIHQHNSKKRTTPKIWFNPPFAQTVKTNVAKSFFRLLNNIFLSLTYDTRSLTETPSKLVIVYVQCIKNHKATQQERL